MSSSNLKRHHRTLHVTTLLALLLLLALPSAPTPTGCPAGPFPKVISGKLLTTGTTVIKHIDLYSMP